ncbi:MAG TPA: Crp/Fnr family transcriptional regulator [Lacibacter sp.]|nr:Crp/Fnr family transcriptional regulator [Lacibacter sp.]
MQVYKGLYRVFMILRIKPTTYHFAHYFKNLKRRLRLGLADLPDHNHTSKCYKSPPDTVAPINLPIVMNCTYSIIHTDLLLAWGATYHEYEKGHVLFYEGNTAHFYFQVVEGKIKMCNCNEDGKEFIQGFFEEGESFGEPPLFDNGTYPASAVADTNVTIIRLRKENFLQLLKDNFDIHYNFTQLLAKRLRFKSLMSKEISSYGPQHRIMSLLKEYKKNKGLMNGSRMKVELTRQQIADMTGLRVETVIRSIRELYDEGKLVIEKGKVFC